VTCQETQRLLSELQEGALAAPQHKDVEAHLSGCASCRTEHDRTKALNGFLRDAFRVPEPAGDFWARQEAGILKTAARPAPPVRGKKGGSRMWFLGVGLGLAAAALVAVAVGLSIGSSPASPAPKEEAKEVAPAPTPEGVEPRKKAVPPTDSRPWSAFAKTPAPQEPAPSANVPSAVLPGDPDYLDRLTNESVEVGLAQTPGDRLLGLVRAAGSRLRELKAAVAARKDVVAEDLAEAYTMIVRDGISGLLLDPEESGDALDDARGIARNYAASNIEDLKSLEAGAEGSLKTAIVDALRATRELAGR
jgi:hypothetical protein